MYVTNKSWQFVSCCCTYVQFELHHL